MDEVPTIRFPSRLTDLDLENFIRKVDPTKPTRRLLLPKEHKGFGFGAHGIAFQYLMTWVLQGGEESVDTKSLDTSLPPDELTKYPHWAALVGMLSNIQKYKPAVEHLIESQHKQRSGSERGALSWHIFFDKGNYRNSHNPHFYLSPKEFRTKIRPNDDLASTIQAMMRQTMKNVWFQKISLQQEIESWMPETLELLGGLFAEIFVNSDEHGAFDEKRTDRIRGARLVYTNGLNPDEKYREKLLSKASPILRNFVNRTRSRKMFEVGVVDSGLGFYKRQLADMVNKDPDNTDEYKVFQDCFDFLKSTSGGSSKGLGLPRVLQALTELGGLIRIRTGRLNLLRDLGEHPYDYKRDDLGFYDWKTGARLKTGVRLQKDYCHHQVKGTAVTIIIPSDESISYGRLL